MGKVFDPPITEELSPVPLVPEQVKTEISSLENITPLGNKTKVNTLSSVIDPYIKQLDLFHQFVLDKHPAVNKKDRQDAMAGFIRLFQNLLKLDYPSVNTCLNHFLTNVGKEYKTYNKGELFSPIFTMTRKEIPYDCKTERFMDLVFFLIALQGSFSTIGATKFVNGRDMNYFFRQWGKKEKENIVNYIHSKMQ